jgi:hypothetical protein
MGDGAASGGGSHWTIQGERDLLVWAAMVPQEVVHPTTGRVTYRAITIY